MGRADPGPNALLVSLTDAELKQRVTTALDSFDGYVGVNFTWAAASPRLNPAWRRCCASSRPWVAISRFAHIGEQSLGDASQEIGVASLARNVFLDDDELLDAVRRRLDRPGGGGRARQEVSFNSPSAIRTR